MNKPGNELDPKVYSHTGTGYYIWTEDDKIKSSGNVFCAEKDFWLQSAGLYCPAGGSYTVELRVFSDGEDPFAGSPVMTVSGNSEHLAFVKAKFKQKTYIREGQCFSLSASIKDSEGKDIFFNEGFCGSTNLTGVSHIVSSDRGQSYLLYENEGYKDIKDTSYSGKNNICLYAFGNQYPKDGWVKETDGWRYYSSGKNIKGWLLDKDGKTYYLMPDTGIMKHGWLELNGIWYLLSPDKKTGWNKKAGKWYYFDRNGVMKDGIVSVDGKKYGLSVSGALVFNGWLEVGGYWYHTDKNGVIYTSKWLKSKQGYYYFDNSGKMLSDTTATIDGEAYSFDADGLLIE